MNLYFAGLARDCGANITENLNKILDICDEKTVEKACILIAENDSVDDTRNIIKEFSKKYGKIDLFLFDDLDDDIEIRENRLAYLRQHLLEEIKNKKNPKIPGLYIPIDLDSQIAQSIDSSQFIKECRRIINGKTDAVFPVSEPYYYDIWALRASNWVENDCWAEVSESRKRLGSFISKYKYIYLKQTCINELDNMDRITVESAFGGVGIYNLKEALDAEYKNNEGYPTQVCEHVVFNKCIESKEISTDFVVQAPYEHIRCRTSPYWLFLSALKSTLDDILLAGATIRQFIRSF